MSPTRIPGHGRLISGCTVGYLLPSCVVLLSSLFVVSQRTLVGDCISRRDAMPLLLLLLLVKVIHVLMCVRIKDLYTSFSCSDLST